MEECTSTHCRTCNDIFSHRFVHEVFWRNNNASTRGDVFFRDDAEDSTEMICVRVGVNHGSDRAMSKLGGDEFVAVFCGLRRGERVNHNPSGVSLDECDV